MNRCETCGHEWEGKVEVCPACKTTTHAADGIETVIAEDHGYTPTSPFPSASREPAEGELEIGSLFAGRYRIDNLLGRGGMGIVYRAEDQTLGQTVALKFLPAKLRSEQRRVDRFLGEVRHAREIAHQNVCRVYDVGEAEDRLFLSMEYIDGEDLSTLLRRIGRLPHEKATDIARQLCSGLEALHENGMLHRDLKPANVMLDGRGRVRITDFGLAGIAADISGADIRSGTPQYMSPEQLEGREVSIRSDVYALGLVLYEVFTGKPAFEADTVEEFRRKHLEESPISMGSVVSEIDPAIELILERCLEKDPQQRPPTVSAVALALPGGDPLAAALALGDTPSPELVASAGGGVRLRPLWGMLLMTVFLSGLWIESVGKGARSLVDHMNLDRPTAAQEERARTLITELGFTTPPVDSYGSYESRKDILRWISDKSGRDWTRVEESWPSPLVYWYRQDGDWLAPQNPNQLVTRTDPPPGRPGAVEVVLSHRGDLQSFRATPEAGGKRGEPGLDPAKLNRLVSAAGLDPDAFEFVDKQWTPVGFADRTAILRGPDPGGAPLELRVASLGGKISEFTIAGPWDRPTPPTRNRPGDAFVLVVLLVVLGFASLMSFRNLREGRVDPRSAARVAATVLALPILAWIIRGHHPPLAQTTLTGFLRAFSEGALFAMFCLALYLAVEPVLRRVWPQMLISWTRATTGGFNGPTVGTALLAGAAGFAVAVWINQFTGSLRILTSRAVLPAEVEWIALGSTGGMLGILTHQVPVQLFTALLYTTVLVLLRMMTRSRVIASVGFVIIIGIIMTATASGKQFGLTTGLLTAALWLALLLRAGLLALVTAKILVAVFLRFPVTTDLTQIHGRASMLLLALLVGLMVWALFQAVGGRQLVDERRAETLG